VLATLGPTFCQVLLIESRRARSRLHSVPLRLHQAHPFRLCPFSFAKPVHWIPPETMAASSGMPGRATSANCRTGSRSWNKIRSQQSRTARVANRNRPDSGAVGLCAAGRTLTMGDTTKIGSFIQSSPHPAWLATTQSHCVYANLALGRLALFNSDPINDLTYGRGQVW
jgi:hypothetical protein